MANFGSGRGNRSFGRDGNRSGNRYGMNRDRGFGDRGNRGSRNQMHEATCSKCGKSCQVPFRPTGSKPVFCSSCFEQTNQKSSFSPREDNRRFNNPPQQGNSSEQLNQINKKLDKIITILQELEMYEDEENDDEEDEDSDETSKE